MSPHISLNEADLDDVRSMPSARRREARAHKSPPRLAANGRALRAPSAIATFPRHRRKPPRSAAVPHCQHFFRMEHCALSAPHRTDSDIPDDQLRPRDHFVPPIADHASETTLIARFFHARGFNTRPGSKMRFVRKLHDLPLMFAVAALRSRSWAVPRMLLPEQSAGADSTLKQVLAARALPSRRLPDLRAVRLLPTKDGQPDGYDVDLAKNWRSRWASSSRSSTRRARTAFRTCKRARSTWCSATSRATWNV